jgi:co-chaperonin GroES (HSP10)
MKIRALTGKILATEIEVGERKTDSGIVLLDDNGKEEGIRPRWMQVYSKGAETTDEIKVGDWICVEHGRWTRGMEVRTEEDEILNLWSVDPDAIILVSEERPVEFAKRY